MTTTDQQHGKTILVLEDEEQLARALKDALAMRGFVPVIVSNVEDALRELEQRGSFDVIWLDHYLLGTGNGVDFVVRLKQHDAWRSIPIFVVSNSTSASNVRSYIRLGVSNYYTKSDFDVNQIIDDVIYSLDHHE